MPGGQERVEPPRPDRLLDLAEISAGGKRTPSAGHDHHPNVIVSLDGLDVAFDQIDALRVDRVELARPIEHEVADRTTPLEEDLRLPGFQLAAFLPLPF